MDFIFDLIFFLVPIFILAIWIFVIAMLVSPKLRGKMMSRQVKATKYMFDEAEEDLKDIATKGANAGKDAIQITTKAIKDGLTASTVYCKHCGKSIDSDSSFCKHCGKEQ